MTNWENESFDLLNQARFSFIDPGPLHAPIHKFSIRRGDQLNLILETEVPPDAESTAVKHPSGTVRINRDQAKLAYTAGVEAVLTGVQPLTLIPRYDGNDIIALKEVAHVRELKVTLGDLGSAAYTIEWLENLPASPFIWPDSVDTVTETTTTRSIALSDDGITLSSCNRRQSVTSNAAKLTVAGQTLYVCAPNRESPNAPSKPPGVGGTFGKSQAACCAGADLLSIAEGPKVRLTLRWRRQSRANSSRRSGRTPALMNT